MSDKPAIESPCILICAIEPVSGHCYGCGRSRSEIARWTSFSHEERSDLMKELPDRVAKLERRPRRVTKRSMMKGETSRRDVLDLTQMKS